MNSSLISKIGCEREADYKVRQGQRKKGRGSPVRIRCGQHCNQVAARPFRHRTVVKYSELSTGSSNDDKP